MLITPINFNTNNRQNKSNTSFGTKFIGAEEIGSQTIQSAHNLAKELKLSPDKGFVKFVEDKLKMLQEGLNYYNLDSQNHLANKGIRYITNLVFRTEDSNKVVATAIPGTQAKAKNVKKLLPRADFLTNSRLYLEIHFNNGKKIILHNLEQYERKFSREKASIGPAIQKATNELDRIESRKSGPTPEELHRQRRHEKFAKSHSKK